MNAVVGDTSAFLALLNASDENHDGAVRAFATLRARGAAIVSTSYVLVGTYALIGRRLGLEADRRFRSDFAPLIDVIWIDETLHDSGVDLLLRSRKAAAEPGGCRVIRHDAPRRRHRSDAICVSPACRLATRSRMPRD